MLEEICASGAGTSGASPIHFSIFPPMPIVKFGSEEQKRKYLPGIATGEIKLGFSITEPDVGTDTTRIFLEVLPLIRPGVMVHIHDICLPFEYSALFTERMYAEQYLLACTLMDSAKWRPLLPVHYLDSKACFAAIARPGAVNTSFWMVRL